MVGDPMEAFLASYGIAFQEFRALLERTRGVVAGSAPLALFLAQEGIEPGFSPSDLDIWVHDNETSYVSTGIYQHSNLHLYTELLRDNGFVVERQFEPHEDYDNLHHITRILFFYKGSKMVQVIFLKVSKLYRYILENFDLTVCMTWWNAKINRFETMWPLETPRKEMYHYPMQSVQSAQRAVIPRESVRISKYKARGFTLLEPPCAELEERDRRTSVGALTGQAFDIFAYEDVDAAEFLRASAHHLLLRVGEQFYAFHRKALHKYFTDHLHHHARLGELADTPHKQTILSFAAQQMQYSDYSIAELVPAYTLVIGAQQKSMYATRLYTVEGWLIGVPSVEIPLNEVEAIHEETDGSHVQHPLYHPDVYWME
jgi:hypothetical protein